MKIIASDYDGTLNHNGIDEKKKSAISDWRKNGNLFGIISGRGYKSLKSVIDKVPFEYDFLVCNNGATIYNTEGQLLKEIRCDGKIAKPFIEDLFSWRCPFADIDKDVSFIIRADINECDDDEYTFESMPEVSYFNQISTMLSDTDEASAVVEKIKNKYSDILTPLQNGNCIDIVPKGVNKAQGIYELLSIFGGSYDDVIAVGDNINDTDMIAEFRSYAMENAVDSIKALADEIISDITELIEKEL